MAGHSQFANIMHRKGAQDKKRAKLFARLTREVIVAAKSGLPDPDGNPRLRSAIQAARAQNMPKDNIDRAIKRATGEDKDTNWEEIRYEGYGPGGVAIIVEATTDNRNRTAGEVRTLFAKNGGTLGETNSVSFMFERVGLIDYPAAAGKSDAIFEAAVEAGAADVQSGAEGHEIVTAPDDLGQVREALGETLGEPREARLAWRSLTVAPIDDAAAETLFKLLEALEDNDDVQSVAANYEVSDEVLQRLAG